jgi:type II secretory pathway pseudopilin PulG
MRRRDQRGFTVVELLLAAAMMLIVLSATMGVLDHVFNDAAQNDTQNDTGQAARQTADTLARQLRNLASPTADSGSTIDDAGATDFTFQTADPARTWVRYCLLTSNSGSPDDGLLYEDTTTASTPGSTTSCPGTGWITSRVVTDHVTNLRDGLNRSLFTYICADGGTTCTGSSSTLDQVTRVRTTLWVDANGASFPSETPITSGVYLRNQNQAPTARESVSPLSGQARTYLLNGSASTDPEGRTLNYHWFKSAAPSPVTCGALPPTGSADYLGEGITLTATLSSGSQSVYLVVCDPGDRPSVSDPTTVNVP